MRELLKRTFISALAAFLVAAIVFFGLKILDLGSSGPPRIPDDLMRDLAQIQQNFIQEAKEQIKAKGYYESDPGKLRQQLAPLEAKTQQLPPKQRQVVEVVLSILEKMIAQGAVYQAKESELESKNILRSPSGIKTKQDLEAFKPVVASFRQANHGLEDVINGVDDELRTGLAGAHLSTSDIEAAVSAMRKAMHLEQLIPIRKLDEKIADILDQTTTLLEKSWGSWQVTGNQLHFRDPSVLDQFNALISSLQQAASEQTQLQTTLVSKYQ